MYQNGTQNIFKYLIEIYFDQQVPWNSPSVPWNFSKNLWTTFVVPLNSGELKQHKLKFHGISFRSKVPWISLELFHTPKFHGIPWNWSILNTPVSAKMAQDQRKWHAVLLLFIPRNTHTYIYINIEREWKKEGGRGIIPTNRMSRLYKILSEFDYVIACVYHACTITTFTTDI